MKRSVSTNIHPGIILKEDVLEANNLTIGQGADLLGVSRLTLLKITNGKGAITPNIALRIEKAFGGNADFWLRMQRGYDLILI
jgi:addiction module HigA family antidote